MMGNPGEISTETDFFEIIGNDEEESGSEVGEEIDEEDEVVLDEMLPHEVGDLLEVQLEVNDEQEIQCSKADSESMPTVTVVPESGLQSLNETSPLIHRGRNTSSTFSSTGWRDRSPSRSPQRPQTRSTKRSALGSPQRAPKSPPCSPDSSPRHRTGEERSFAFYSKRLHLNQREDEETTVKTNQYTMDAPHQDSIRGKPRSRGSRLRGGNSGRGRTSTNTDNDGVDWRPGERMIEIYLDDEDVPPKLREMVHELQAKRNARHEQKERLNVKVSEDDDSNEEYHDAESFIANELFEGDNSALDFDWNPMATFTGTKETFQPEQTGPCCDLTSGYEAFRYFWDDHILEHIVTETNRYASKLMKKSKRFTKDWYDTNVHEIMILFAFWIMLGIVRMPSIKSCFSTHALLKTEIFRTLMTEQRYWVLNRALHFVDNAMRRKDSPKSFCFGPVMDHLNHKFMEAYTPSQDISIEECVTIWKSKLPLKQYFKTKASQFGIKTYELCESATGYLWSFFIYLGKDNSATSASASRLPQSTEVVVRLIRPLLNQGYRLFMDSWFNSPLLARFLKRNQTDCVGTLRKDCKNVPPLIQLATIPEGKCVARHSGDVVVMAYQDKFKTNKVYTISTCHGTESVCVLNKSDKSSRYKPAVIEDCNSFADEFDKNQTLEPYLMESKNCINWYKKMFKRLLNVTIFNSRILVNKSMAKTDDQVEQLVFRLDLVQEIMKRHLGHAPKPRQRVCNKYTDPSKERLSGSHFVMRADVSEQKTAGSSRTSKNRRYCVWCSVRDKRYRKTVWKCEQCKVPLCISGCFKNYHTIL